MMAPVGVLAMAAVRQVITSMTAAKRLFLSGIFVFQPVVAELAVVPAVFDADIGLGDLFVTQSLMMRCRSDASYMFLIS